MNAELERAALEYADKHWNYMLSHDVPFVAGALWQKSRDEGRLVNSEATLSDSVREYEKRIETLKQDRDSLAEKLAICEEQNVLLTDSLSESTARIAVLEGALWDIGMRSVYPLSINEANFLDIKRVATDALGRKV